MTKYRSKDTYGSSVLARNWNNKYHHTYMDLSWDSPKISELSCMGVLPGKSQRLQTSGSCYLGRGFIFPVKYNSFSLIILLTVLHSEQFLRLVYLGTDLAIVHFLQW
jgi:hypothetical protein